MIYVWKLRCSQPPGGGPMLKSNVTFDRGSKDYISHDSLGNAQCAGCVCELILGLPVLCRFLQLLWFAANQWLWGGLNVRQLNTPMKSICECFVTCPKNLQFYPGAYLQELQGSQLWPGPMLQRACAAPTEHLDRRSGGAAAYRGTNFFILLLQQRRRSRHSVAVEGEWRDLYAAALPLLLSRFFLLPPVCSPAPLCSFRHSSNLFLHLSEWRAGKGPVNVSFTGPFIFWMKSQWSIPITDSVHS